jgi:hypothetical protein
MTANRKAKKLSVDNMCGILEGENKSESDFGFSEGEFELDSSSSGAYESSDEEIYDCEFRQLVPK